MRRHSPRAVFLGVEPGEMRAEDFLLFELLDPARTRIPVGDFAGRRQHVDGVVGAPVAQRGKPLLAPPQRSPRRAFSGVVGGVLAEADEFPRLVPDLVDDDTRPELGTVLADTPAFGFELA